MSLGCYEVGERTVYSKSLASHIASRTKQCPRWLFHNDVWDTFANIQKHTLGQVSLDALYRDRAQQIRDQHDYLILNYSGGPDSHNVLMSFLNNGIPLDEIYVQRSESVESKLYTPNTDIKGAENLLSEWDYSIKPKLDWVAKNHPNTKINIHDVYKNVTPSKFYNQDTFTTSGAFTGAFELVRQSSYSSSIAEQADKGKSVADIWGIDKPIIHFNSNQMYLSFTDTCVDVANRLQNKDHYSVELFYWSPKFPRLVFEQAYVILQFFKKSLSSNIHLRDFIDNCDKLNRGELLRRLYTKLLYTTWDYSFQAEKPMRVNDMGRSRDLYFIQSTDPWLASFKDQWQHHFDSWNVKQTYCETPWYKVGEL